MDKNEYQTTRIWVKTHTLLRKIAAETGESIVEVLDRLATQEHERVKAMARSKQEINDAWGKMMLDEALQDMQAKGKEINPDTFSAYFQQEYELPLNSTEAAQFLNEKW